MFPSADGDSTAAHQAQECRIVSLTLDGSLTFTNRPANLYCGFLSASSLDDCWRPAPSPYWNFQTSNSTTTLQLPPGAMTSRQQFLRLVSATNHLSTGFRQVSVPVAAIAVDGSPTDWGTIEPILSDRIGDALPPPGSTQIPPGSDIKAVYVARDANSVYVRIDITNGPPASSLYFGVSFYTNATSQAGDRFVFINLVGFSSSVEKRRATGSGYHDFLASGVLAGQGNVIEASVPLSALAPLSPATFMHGMTQTDPT
jgi:hypothetical protein